MKSGVDMITSIASWICKCGVRVKAVTETDKGRISQPVSHTVKAKCPACGDEQDVYAHRVVSVSCEKPPDVSNRVKQ
jgi:ribosomal protein S27E